MRNLALLLTILLSSNLSFGQEKYFSRDGMVKFFSSTPVEDIEAINNQASSILNMETGELAFSMLMTGFQFKKALMQEHFNENYVESDKFPKGTFKGKILNWDKSKLNGNDPTAFDVEGEITIHGVTKPYKVKSNLIKKGDQIEGDTKFNIKVADHDIKIPSAVVDNIAEEVEVTINITYKPYNK